MVLVPGILPKMQLRLPYPEQKSDLLLACLLARDFFFANLASMDASARFPRGVQRLGGPSSVAVPQYGVSGALNRVIGISISTLDLVPFLVRQQVYLYGIRKPGEFGIPERCMMATEFYDWYEKEYGKKVNHC